MKAFFHKLYPDAVVMPKKDYVEEHKRLLNALKSRDPKLLMDEVREQTAEVKKELEGGRANVSKASGFIQRMMAEHSAIKQGKKLTRKGATRFDWKKLANNDQQGENATRDYGASPDILHRFGNQEKQRESLRAQKGRIEFMTKRLIKLMNQNPETFKEKVADVVRELNSKTAYTIAHEVPKNEIVQLQNTDGVPPSMVEKLETAKEVQEELPKGEIPVLTHFGNLNVEEMMGKPPEGIEVVKKEKLGLEQPAATPKPKEPEPETEEDKWELDTEVLFDRYDYLNLERNKKQKDIVEYLAKNAYRLDKVKLAEVVKMLKDKGYTKGVSNATVSEQMNEWKDKLREDVEEAQEEAEKDRKLKEILERAETSGLKGKLTALISKKKMIKKVRKEAKKAKEAYIREKKETKKKIAEEATKQAYKIKQKSEKFEPPLLGTTMFNVIHNGKKLKYDFYKMEQNGKLVDELIQELESLKDKPEYQGEIEYKTWLHRDHFGYSRNPKQLTEQEKKLMAIDGKIMRLYKNDMPHGDSPFVKRTKFDDKSVYREPEDVAIYEFNKAIEYLKEYKRRNDAWLKEEPTLDKKERQMMKNASNIKAWEEEKKRYEGLKEELEKQEKANKVVIMEYGAWNHKEEHSFTPEEYIKSIEDFRDFVNKVKTALTTPAKDSSHRYYYAPTKKGDRSNADLLREKEQKDERILAKWSVKIGYDKNKPRHAEFFPNYSIGMYDKPEEAKRRSEERKEDRQRYIDGITAYLEKEKKRVLNGGLKKYLRGEIERYEKEIEKADKAIEANKTQYESIKASIKKPLERIEPKKEDEPKEEKKGSERYEALKVQHKSWLENTEKKKKRIAELKPTGLSNKAISEKMVAEGYSSVSPSEVARIVRQQKKSGSGSEEVKMCGI